MLESLFNKVASLSACSFIRKRLKRRHFPMKLAKFLRTPFFYRTLPVAVSDILEAVQECYSFIHIVGKMKEISRSRRCSRCSCKSDQSILEIMAKFMLMEVTET